MKKLIAAALIAVLVLVSGSAFAEEPVETVSEIVETIATPEPVVEEPVVEEPVIEEPVAEEPVAEEPIPETPVTETAPEITRTIEVLVILPEGQSAVFYGDEVTLQAILTGYEGVEVTYQWQKTATPEIEESWTDIEGETESSMTFVSSEETDRICWRVWVETAETETEADAI